MSTQTNTGCQPLLKQAAENLDAVDFKKLSVLRLLRHRENTWLGVTEPTLCNANTKRLQEINPGAAEMASFKTADQLILQEADYAHSQHLLGDTQATGQLQLPKIVQYDLFHITEALPQQRDFAAASSGYSFFFRENAKAEILAHLRRYHELGVIPCLLWHTYHPRWGNQTFEEITAQEADAFGAGPATEVADLLLLAHHIHVPESAWNNRYDPRQQHLLRSLQQKLDRIANFANELAKNEIVCLFRPYHEANGHWFWWSIQHFNADRQVAGAQFAALWRNTRRYLEEVRGVRNLLWVWSPNVVGEWVDNPQRVQTDYLFPLAPADADVLGLDFYANNINLSAQDGRSKRAVRMSAAFEMLAAIRRAFPDKPVGFTELGMRHHLDLNNGQRVASPQGGDIWLDTDLQQHFMSSDTHPHFTIFWRNEPGAMEQVVAGQGIGMDRSFRWLWANLSTRLTDVTPVV
ncbi:MAG: glycosyl hydrolase [Bacteroidota bacterium]